MSQPKRLLLDPLEALLLTRDRIQEVLDDAVARGRMTRDDASELLAELVRRGRRSTDELVDSLASLPPDRVMREVDRARRAAGLGSSFPITGYDELTAAKVVDRLEGLSAAELRAVRDHERRNANRKSVLNAIERRLS
jgi:polyhydroxyalkanoate synthesis regulator phasin